MSLLDKFEKAKRKLRRKKKQRHEARPGSDRREKLARLVQFWRERKETLANKLKTLPGPPFWGGCRAITNEVIRIVDGRAGVTSRKRWATFGNPGSDHHMSQVWADAVDFGIANAFLLAAEIRRKLTGNGAAVHRDYEAFYIKRRGRTYRVQIIAGTHGTGPHLHVGVRRV